MSDEVPRQATKERRIVGTGLVCLDVVRLPDGRTQTFAGGTCGNVLAILAYLGWTSTPVARLSRDSAGENVEKDLEQWGVELDHLHCEPQASTPVIVETLRVTTSGYPVHKFSLRCPTCKGWFPTYRPVTVGSAETTLDTVKQSDVFFYDRASPGALVMAAAAKKAGATIVFEPASIGNPSHFGDSVRLADIVKYSRDRFDQIGYIESDAGPALEVMTLGEDGLRFRKRNRSGAMGRWYHLEAVPTPILKDSAGAGDWTTALLIDEIAGRQQFSRDLTVAELTKILSYAQAAAAWSCQFEAPRGGMYVSSPEDFRRAVDDSAHDATSLPEEVDQARAATDFCPSCK